MNAARTGPSVLIAVATDMLGLARVPRLLVKAGCTVTLLSPENLLVARSRFVDHRIRTPEGPEQVAEALRRHLETRQGGYAWTIIGDEPLLKELSRRRKEGWVRPVFPVDPEGEGVDIMTSKTAFTEAASRTGLPVPSYSLCSTLEEVEAAAGTLGFPLVIKESSGSGGLQVRIVSGPEALQGAFESLEDGDPLLIQAFVPGLVGSTEVLYDHGRPVCWNSSYTVETFPKGTGASCIRKITVHPAIEEIVHRVGSLISFHGLGGIDWIHDPVTDLLKVIEFNPRPTPGYHFGPVGGVDFSLAVRDMMEGKKTVRKPHIANGQETLVSLFPQYVVRMVDARDLRGIMKWLFGESPRKDMPLDDPGLFLALLMRVWQKFEGDVKKMVRRRLTR